MEKRTSAAKLPALKRTVTGDGSPALAVAPGQSSDMLCSSGTILLYGEDCVCYRQMLNK